MNLREQTARALLSEVAGREAIAFVVPLLERAQIATVPLKGVWLQRCVYRGEGTRAITDVDLLVREDTFAAAIDTLRSAGFRARDQHTASERTLDHAELALPIDLHCRLFTRAAFRLSTASVFDRARADVEAFGVPVLLPDPRDVFAHLVGHFVKNRTRQDDRTRLADFSAIAACFDLDPMALARHLHAAGMGRATRYALHDLARAEGDAFFRTVIAALPRDAIGERIATAARLLARRAAATPGSTLGALPGFLLDRSLAAGALSLLLRLNELSLGRPGARRMRPM